MNRREFLKRSGMAAAGLAALSLPGCAGSAVSPAAPSQSGRPTAPSQSGPPTDAQWNALAARLAGTLVLPGNAAYSTGALLFNPRFDSIRPAAIVYCQSAADIQRTIAFAQQHGLPLAVRAGGHSYAGYSLTTGIVCDVSRMSQVTVLPSGQARVGAGTRLIDCYSAMAAQQVAIAGGSCPTVGITGLTLGGGIGVLGRKFGLTCDSLTEVELVTAAGTVLTCNATENSDLYWACRGSGGGNFGIVTALTFATQPEPTLTLFQCQWDWTAAEDVMAGWQQWITTLPDEVWSNCHALSAPSSATPAITVGGACVGSQQQLAPWLTSLAAAVGGAPSYRSVGTYDYLDGMLVEAGCAGMSVAACHLPQQTPQGTLSREASLAHSDIAVAPLGASALAVIIAAVEQRQANPDVSTVAGVAFDALGGAINRVAADATAFVHRNGLCDIQYNATWPTGAPAAIVASNISGVNQLYQAMRPYASGQAYQNYIDAELADWQNAYYGANLARLCSVKRRYDPQDFFHFAQSIPLA